MKAFFAFILALFLFSGEAFAENCGPNQCYEAAGCSGKIKIDFVFIIDTSGSMGGEINGVRNGMRTFVDNLEADTDSRFAMVLFGGRPRYVLNLSNKNDFQNRLASVGIDGGGHEAGLEALLMSMGDARRHNFNISYRNGAKKVYILLTDEESDQPWHSDNREFNGADNCQSNFNTACQREVDDVAFHMIQKKAIFYVLVNRNLMASTREQYGNPNAMTRAQNADFSNFNPQVALSELVAQGSGQSLQAQMLRAGLLSRSFDVEQANNPNFIKNFFETIIADVSVCERCLKYECQGSKCLTPRNICDCNGVINGPAVTDVNGACCRPDQIDCLGICNGGNKPDPCGICTRNGQRSSLCLNDCSSNYIERRPPSNIVYSSQCPDVANYLVANPDLRQQVVKGDWTLSSSNTEDVCNHFNYYGRFEGSSVDVNNVVKVSRSICEFDAAKYASDHGVSVQNAKKDFLDNGVKNGKAASCVAGTKKSTKVPPRDRCNQCVPILDDQPYCVKDCKDQWRSNPSLVLTNDDCGVCDGGNSLKDDCGTCRGPGKDQCGKCPAEQGYDTTIDACGNPSCKGLTCTKDCRGEFVTGKIEFRFNQCDMCVLEADLTPDNIQQLYSVRENGNDKRVTNNEDVVHCRQDCNSQYYTVPKNYEKYNSNGFDNDFLPHFVDECGNCVKRSLGIPRAESCKQDCNGVWDGKAFEDKCGTCVETDENGDIDPVNGEVNYECVPDCKGIYYIKKGEPQEDNPPNEVDDCGICQENTPPGWNSLKDKCGRCTNAENYDTLPKCVADCRPEFVLETEMVYIEDACGDCVVEGSKEYNARRDACFICRDGGEQDPNWNDGIEFDTTGLACPCNVSPIECPNNATETRCDPKNCPGSPCINGAPLDPVCGSCPGEQKLDDCEICCQTHEEKDGKLVELPSNNCNADKLACGECFLTDCGTEPPCPEGETKDCNGVCFLPGQGQRVCNTVCGDGKVDVGEECDNGEDLNGQDGNECGSDCKLVAASSAGVVVGAILGGLVAFLLVGAAVFFAVNYAVSTGLLGKAGTAVDMGASNSNPLYKGETNIQSNPLYSA